MESIGDMVEVPEGLQELFDEEYEAYLRLNTLRRGDRLIPGAQPDFSAIDEARQEWLRRRETLVDAGGTPSVIREMLSRRADSFSKRVKRRS